MISVVNILTSFSVCTSQYLSSHLDTVGTGTVNITSGVLNLNAKKSRRLDKSRRLFNKSLSQGIVPDDFKIAKVVPIYKKRQPGNIWQL